jgi:ubiquinone/menaquinone biosynthesis C-methylase UbiE
MTHARAGFYRHLFPGEISDAHVVYHQLLESSLPPTGAILDLGCGRNSDLARYRRRGLQVWGTDVQAHPHLEHRDWFREQPEVQIPFPDESFDVVASRWVLEHVQEPAVFLGEVYRVLRPGGAFISTTVNGAHYVTWLTRLLHLAPHRLSQRLVHWLYGRAHHDTFPTYYRMNSTGRLKRAARAAGLHMAPVLALANPDYFSFSLPLTCAAMLVDRILEGIWPGLGRIYWVVAMYKPVRPSASAPLVAA